MDLTQFQHHTPGPWDLKAAVIHPTDRGGYGTPCVLEWPKVIIPEHFDMEANDSTVELTLQTEGDALLISKAPELLAYARELERRLAQRGGEEGGR